MPLKFLKKCRQYNVTSKSLFVISVHHLLDTTTTVDCTISSESKGQECLDNVCQRLLIQQPEFFGLRYLVKGKEDEMKWVDLERSLSRQLEKYAASAKIYLRVRHYVTTAVRHLSDEVTRYYYFLQLKNDIYDGRIACDIRTAILLALYCRQAEYDSYQNDKQTKDYLKKSLILPKNLQGLANDDSLLDGLIVEVLQQNPGIQHLSTTQAEEMYIQCCQQLEGYGEERFLAKDNLGNDLTLGLSINGMVVLAENGRQYFPWKDFHTVTIDKRTIRIEQNKTDGSLFVGSFIFSEADTARYFWKLCITQHKFFKRRIDEDSSSNMDDVESSHNGMIGGGGGGTVEAINYDLSDSHEDLLLEQRAIYTPGNSSNPTTVVNHHFPSQQDYLPSTQSLHLQSAAGSAMNPSASNLMSSNISLATSQQSGNGNSGNALPVGHTLSGGMTAMNHNWINKDYTMASQHLSQSILDTRMQSSSCQDLTNNLHNSSAYLSHSNNNNINNNNNDMLTADAHERERLKAMLPTYRPAPDYETAIQLKYRSTSNDLPNLNQMQYQAVALATHGPAAYYAGSQPDIHQTAGIFADGVLLGHLPAHYPDVAQPAAALHAHHHLNAAAAAAAAAAASSGGTVLTPSPNSNIYVDLSQRLHMIRSKPPPPYPVNRLSSSSTPDLAVASHRPLLGFRSYVSGSSPDLVSNRNFINSQYSQYPIMAGAATEPAAANGNMTTSSGATMLHQYQYIAHMGPSQNYMPAPHGTFENLNMIEEQPSIMSQLQQSVLNQTALTASHNYEKNSSALPATNYPIPIIRGDQGQTNPTMGGLQRSTTNGSIEPIYENVPLPQYNSHAAIPQRRSSGSSSHNSETSMRNRTSSIQSAPGGMNPQVEVVLPSTTSNPRLNNKYPVTGETDANASKQHSTYNDRRAAATDIQLITETTPIQRTNRASSTAPAFSNETASAADGNSSELPIKMTPPPRQHKPLKATASNIPTMPQPLTSTPSSCTIRPEAGNNDLLHQQLAAMNLSNGSPLTYNSTFESNSENNTTINSFNNKVEKQRKKRWNFLGRSKTPDKQKSATLGRDKSTANNKTQKNHLVQDDSNLPHRWSTGGPKLQPISGQYSKEKLSQILTDKLNDSQLYMEFEAIPKRREMASYECALFEENMRKNSDPNFLPYDDNRVRLTPTMENRHGYVNASHISATVGSKQRFYIVAQSPYDHLTTHIFWQCIWEADVYLIVQLSEELNYIPPNSSQRMEFGQFQVYQEFSQTTDRCITSKLRLYHIQSRRYRSVWHLNYIDWVEQNCPRDVNHFLDFLEELNSVRMASINEVPPGHNTNPPVLLHCLEGGGRSGVTLTADLLLYTLDHNEDLDLPRVISQLRHQRDSIIPSLAQYKFVYNILVTYLKRSRLI